MKRNIGSGRTVPHEDQRTDNGEGEEKALQETILRVKEHSIEEATKNLDPTDIQGLQRLMNEKRKMQDLRTLHISIN